MLTIYANIELVSPFFSIFICSLLVSRLGRSGSGSPDSMSSSYHGNTSTTSSMHGDVNSLIQMSASLMENVKSDQSIMVQSLDPTILTNSTSTKSNNFLNETTCVRSVIPQLNGMVVWLITSSLKYCDHDYCCYYRSSEQAEQSVDGRFKNGAGARVIDESWLSAIGQCHTWSSQSTIEYVDTNQSNVDQA